MYKNIVFFLINILFLIPSSIIILNFKIGPICSGAILLYYTYYAANKTKYFIKLSLFLLLFPLKNLLNLSTTEYFFDLLYISIQYLFLFSIFQSFLQKSIQIDYKSIHKYYYNYLCLIVIVNALVYVGIIPQFGKGYSLENYGFDTSGFTGVFDNYGASIIFAFTAVNLLFYLVNNNFKKEINIVLVAITVLFIYKTYFRTGYACLLVGIIFILVYSKINIKIKIKNIATIIICISLFTIYKFNNDPAFKYRITESNETTNISDKEINSLGSGRVDFFEKGIEIFKESTLFAKIFGYGLPKTQELMGAKTGMKIFMHNEYMNSLIQNGIIGLGILLGINYYMLLFIIKYKKSVYYSLSLANFAMLNTFFLLQGGPSPILYTFITFSLFLQLTDHTITK